MFIFFLQNRACRIYLLLRFLGNEFLHFLFMSFHELLDVFLADAAVPLLFDCFVHCSLILRAIFRSDFLRDLHNRPCEHLQCTARFCTRTVIRTVLTFHLCLKIREHCECAHRLLVSRGKLSDESSEFSLLLLIACRREISRPLLQEFDDHFQTARGTHPLIGAVKFTRIDFLIQNQPLSLGGNQGFPTGFIIRRSRKCKLRIYRINTLIVLAQHLFECRCRLHRRLTPNIPHLSCELVRIHPVNRRVTVFLPLAVDVADRIDPRILPQIAFQLFQGLALRLFTVARDIENDICLGQFVPDVL